MKTQLFDQLNAYCVFWSYAIQTIDEIPNALLIEQTLRYGDVKELFLLFRIFDKASIRQVWRNILIPDQRFYARNYYLAKIFFNIQNPKRYMKPLQKKLSRYEKLNRLIA